MTELLLLVCTITGACKDVSLNISDAMTPMQCMMKAQPEAAKWVNEHPGWRVAKITCGRLGRYARV